MKYGRLKQLLVGKPLASEMAHNERIPKWKALAVLSSDALSSVAYATEEILIPLSLFATAAVAWSMPIAIAIAALLFIVTLSYRQTIEFYPNGGGAYIVAKDNLGTMAGLIAGASLLIDYVLTVSVSVASGVENIASAFPLLREHKEIVGIVIIFFLMTMNLRGVRESATLFALPTYFFIGSIFVLVGAGAFQLLTGHALPKAPLIHEAYPALPLFLILRAFSSGCAAMTGVEAISNGIQIFKEPSQKNAKTTLLWMSVTLGFMFLGITFLAHIYGIIPKEGETAVSLLSHTVFGSSFFYYFVQVCTAMILVLAANTSYADFPRLASLLAKDRFLPRQLASLGDRLVFSNGIVWLSVCAMVLIIMFKGETHHLIPLYAVGVFLSFTLSQGGMVFHHLREREPGWMKSLAFNGLGAISTAVVLTVITMTKFLSGAWMVVVLIPILVFIFYRIHRHYLDVGKELTLLDVSRPIAVQPLKHTVVIPISGIHRGIIEGIRYALSISSDVRACYVELDPEITDRVKEEWRKWAGQIPLVILKSPYRSVVSPVLDYINDVLETTKDDMVTVLIPEFVTAKWWQQFLHNQTAFFIRAALLFKRNCVVTSVRYHLHV